MSNTKTIEQHGFYWSAYFDEAGEANISDAISMATVGGSVGHTIQETNERGDTISYCQVLRGSKTSTPA